VFNTRSLPPDPTRDTATIETTTLSVSITDKMAVAEDTKTPTRNMATTTNRGLAEDEVGSSLNTATAAARQRTGAQGEPPSPAGSEGEDRRVQPWQSLMEEIERESRLSPPGSDYFPCQDGFYAHSLAG
jgi:hypothetical protein